MLHLIMSIDSEKEMETDLWQAAAERSDLKLVPYLADF